MNTKSIHISSNAFLDKRLSSIFGQCEQEGISAVELGSAIPYDSRAYQKVRAKRKILRMLLHNYFPAPAKKFVLNLGAQDKQTLRASRALVKHALELSAEIRAPFYGVHAGFAYYAAPHLLGKKQIHLKRFPLGDCYQIFGESVSLLSSVAKRLGVELLIENNVVEPYNLIGETNKSFLVAGLADSLIFFKEYKDLDIGMLLDVGHLNISSNTLGFDREQYISQLSPYIKAFQLSENNGIRDAHLPFNKKSWFLPSLKKFANAVFTIEVNDDARGAIENAKLLYEILSQ